MTFIAHVGVNDGSDAYTVGANACQEAVSKLDGGRPDLLLVFSSVEYDQERMLAGVRSVGKDALLVGCSTAGEITTNGPAKRKSVAVMAIHAPGVHFSAGAGENIAGGAREAGRKVAEIVKSAGGNPDAFIMFPDVLSGNGADIVRGILDVLGQHSLVVGGAPGDDFKFKKTYQYLNEKIYSGSVLGLGLSGAFKIGVGVKHGWIPIGIPMKVTKSEGSVRHELDGKPAISVYQKYFGEEEAKQLQKETLAQLAITYPLGMSIKDSEEMLIRDPITFDEKGSITCAAEIPEGATVQLMAGSREEAIKAAKIAAQNALSQLEGSAPKAVIIFNCIARNKLFGEHSKEEIDAIQEVIGRDVPLIGFYTYGEQAPIGRDVRNINTCNTDFHNETVVICIIGE
jgi:hypothetical protein